MDEILRPDPFSTSIRLSPNPSFRPPSLPPSLPRPLPPSLPPSHLKASRKERGGGAVARRERAKTALAKEGGPKRGRRFLVAA